MNPRWRGEAALPSNFVRARKLLDFMRLVKRQYRVWHSIA
ncbi:hypothetical protein PATSB16_24490 [Pandoraea thiooxydans]|nr:hypothetical protein PATSB16_24490 [Pandoraea thiooxydans]